MIGSSTLVVKENGKFNIHIFGGLGGYDYYGSLDKGMTPYDEMVRDEAAMRLKGYDNQDEITQSVVDEIEKCCHCNEKEKKSSPGYSRWAGDGIYLLDMDAKKLFRQVKTEKRKDRHWEEITMESIKPKHPRMFNWFDLGYAAFKPEDINLKEGGYDDKISPFGEIKTPCKDGFGHTTQAFYKPTGEHIHDGYNDGDWMAQIRFGNGWDKARYDYMLASFDSKGLLDRLEELEQEFGVEIRSKTLDLILPQLGNIKFDLKLNDESEEEDDDFNEE